MSPVRGRDPRPRPPRSTDIVNGNLPPRAAGRGANHSSSSDRVARRRASWPRASGRRSMSVCEPGGRAVGGVDVAWFSSRRGHAEGPGIFAARDRPRLTAVEPDHGGVLARPVGEDRDARGGGGGGALLLWGGVFCGGGGGGGFFFWGWGRVFSGGVLLGAGWGNRLPLAVGTRPAAGPGPVRAQPASGASFLLQILP